MKKRKVIITAFIVITALLTSSCLFPYTLYEALYPDTDVTPECDNTQGLGEDFPAVSEEDEISVPKKDEIPQEEDEISVPQKDEISAEDEISQEEDVPEEERTIYSLVELRDYLNEKKERDELEIRFEYLGAEKFDAQLIARMLAAFYIQYEYTGNHYTLEITEFPGDRIADAYFSGNTSFLNDDEKQALNEAVKIVEAAKKETDGDYELEIYLHDYLAETITYYNPSVDVPDPSDPPRHLTAVGGLLDKYANCQGYTDSFYLLATIAGFKVGRMCVTDFSGEGHMTNTICLDDEWYIVDVTFDDASYGNEYKTNYRLFNAGADMCDEYDWLEVWEYNPIAEISDQNYYYYTEGEAYESLEAMSEDIVNSWLKGETEFHTLLLNQTVDWSALSDVLYECMLKNNGEGYYYIWSFYTNENTFFIVCFC